MVSIIKRKKGNSNYYYLKHTTRKRQKEKYLGITIPKNIEDIKREFLLNFYREEWLPQLEEIFKHNKKSQNQIPKSILKKLLESFSVNFTYHTQRIEGSALTLRETSNILVDGITPSQKPQSDMIEAKQHQKIFFEMLEHKKKITLDTILYWHEKLFEQTDTNIAGQTRRYPIEVRGSKFEFPFWDEVPGLLKEFFMWYNKNKDKIYPVELVALVHFKFVSIHPFGDGNGRISRLLMNCVLDEKKYPMVIIEYKDRFAYYYVLEKSQLENNPFYFVRWFVNLYIKKNQKLIKQWSKPKK